MKTGDRVYDFGCALSQQLRRNNYPTEPIRFGAVVGVFDWGLRLADPENLNEQWDCQHKEAVPAELVP